ncbi:hypothetical protein ACFCYX_36375 [Streptomyces populi]|uniref:hypothetical protein n=1 Tax=Streptomyces populi TaxID=2058924 RepID=UPI001F0C0FBF|nr:hypothetical protein [Streptomyces populi]
MSRNETAATRDTELEKDRARYGLAAVVMSNLAIAGIAIFGVWQLDGDKAVIVGVLTAAFTAVSSMTTAYLGIKAISNTARSIALGSAPRREPGHAAAEPPAPGAGTPAAEAPAPPAPRAP